jgi:iron(III) transport system ATP-binding protein
MSIQLKDISHRFGHHRVLSDISLDLEAGEILCVIGASGSGKSTLLRIIAGLEPLQQGALFFDGQLMAGPDHCPPPELRPVGLVFQDHALFPHLTVAENVGFGLDHLDSGTRSQEVAQQLASVGLSELAQRYPHTLSGGQQQRIALIRALATKPGIMLLDEPFASVDTPLRRQLREDARGRLRSSATTTIMVTHDPEEAMAMADKILVLSDGVAVQMGTPYELWRNPTHPFVAETIAGLQTIQGVIKATKLSPILASCHGRTCEIHRQKVDGQKIALGLRSSEIGVSYDQGQCTIEDVRFDGQHWSGLIREGDAKLRVNLPSAPEQNLVAGTPVNLSFTNAKATAYN